ncbi:MAG: DUF1080 domain-containing protein [Verrucomicrobiales bacterium]
MRSLLLILIALLIVSPQSSFGQNIPPKGFKALFNGKDLKGWFGHGTKDPRTLWKMSPDELKAHHEKTLKDINAHWSVQNGELVNDGKGLYLTTKKDYKDFELLLEYKTVPKADSGIYLRGVPQVQIWDPTEEAKWKIGADKGSGGLWNNSKGAPGKDPSKRMDRPFGEWNQFRIIMIGEKVTVHLNGEKVVDNVVMENYFDRKIPIFEKGPIQLQTHGGEIRWRNVFIREIEDETGFQTLFNGKDLAGWHGAVNNYEVVDGAIMCKKGKGGTLYAKDEYSDFVFRFEFKLPPGGNNGIAVRSPGKGDPAWEAYEIQVLDNTAEKYAKLQPYQFHGSVYGLAPAKRGALLPVGEWNQQEIYFKGSHIKINLNGTIILDQDVSKIDLSKVKKVPKGVNRSKGFIGFAGHSDPVQFRNVRIKNL